MGSELDEIILEALQLTGNKIEDFRGKLRYSQIANYVLSKLKPKTKHEINSLKVKVSRRLKRLTKRNILERQVLGHQNVVYSLTENAFEKYCKLRYGNIVFSMFSIWTLYNPEDSFPQFKRRVQKWYLEFFGVTEDNLRKVYERLQREYGVSRKRVGRESKP